jgi:carboxymethylenebutenolidase
LGDRCHGTDIYLGDNHYQSVLTAPASGRYNVVEERRMSEFVTLTAADGHELSAYVAKPEGEAIGALVLVQEIFGVNAHIRSVADGYAKDGFVVIAPALFDRFEKGVELKYEGEDMGKAFGLYGQLKPETSLADIAAAYEYVKAEGKAIGVIGYCYGGQMAWLSATRGETYKMQPACTVGYYAGGIGNFATEEPVCPVMLHFGADDTHIGKDQVEAVRAAHPGVEIYLYEGAGHAFANDVRPSYREEAARVARTRTLEFLKRHLG